MIRPKKGFSTFELLIGAFIIMLVALVAIPLLTNYKKTTKLRSEARVLATNLRLTQQQAVSEQIIYTLDLLNDPDGYTISNSQTGDIIKQVIFDPEVTIQSISDFSTSSVEFNSTGAALETGSVTLTNTKNQTSIIEVKPSGYVQVSD
jgi:Tfp pilus assembly protein FimT